MPPGAEPTRESRPRGGAGRAPPTWAERVAAPFALTGRGGRGFQPLPDGAVFSLSRGVLAPLAELGESGRVCASAGPRRAHLFPGPALRAGAAGTCAGGWTGRSAPETRRAGGRLVAGRCGRVRTDLGILPAGLGPLPPRRSARFGFAKLPQGSAEVSAFRWLRQNWKLAGRRRTPPARCRGRSRRLCKLVRVQEGIPLSALKCRVF